MPRKLSLGSVRIGAMIFIGYQTCVIGSDVSGVEDPNTQ